MKPSTWEKFVLKYGSRVVGHHLAHVLGVEAVDVERVRRTGALTHRHKALGFAELFSLWHGRAPEDREWPRPRKLKSGRYELLVPELAFIGTLVGQIGLSEIADAATERLRKLTGDRRASRTKACIQQRVSKMGLQSYDVLGGIALQDAGREIGSPHIVQQAIYSGTLKSFRVGRLHVIPHDEWARWKAARTPPPKGYVPLGSIRLALGISSDSKLPEFAKLGYVPKAILCTNPHMPGVHSTGRGTWYVAREVAQKLVRDRRAGRPMPWHGKPMPDNLRHGWKLWQKRKHPAECAWCARTWGKQGPPSTFEDYCARYPQLTHGTKRHLTREWRPGLSLPEVALHCGVPVIRVVRAVATGTLEAQRIRRRYYVTKTDATRWKARHCPAGAGRFSWIALSSARKTYLFTQRELRGYIANGTLRSKIGTEGPMRGHEYVLRDQVGRLRARVGFTEAQAARRLGLTVARLREVRKGIELRDAAPGRISLEAVLAIRKRLDFDEGYSLTQAASKLRTPVAWVKACVARGAIRLRRSRVDRRQVLVTEPMMQRLRELRARRRRLPRERLSEAWLNCSEAALFAGVSGTTVKRWHAAGEVRTRPTIDGPRFHRRSVRARARLWWSRCRWKRDTRKPAWLSRTPATP